MALKAVILDLDLTLIASAQAEPLRRDRAWPQVYRLIPQLAPYEGIGELLEALRAAGIKIAVVTSSPRPYCERILGHWSWTADATVCYTTPSGASHTPTRSSEPSNC